jgi:hypothetical protein
MCWAKWYDGKTTCIGKRPPKHILATARQLALVIHDYVGTFKGTDWPELPDCKCETVEHRWVEHDDIYSYNGHVCGFKQYVSAYCKECGSKWVESPKNWEAIQAEHGTDIDWRML